MRWMLNNIDQRIFDMNQLMKRACEFKRLDIVQFLCETINHNQLDFTAAFVAAINNVWNDTDESVSKWLINNIDLQLFDMKQITSEVLEVGSDHDKLNMREAVRSVCFVDKIDLLECFLHNVDHSLYDVHHVLKESCRYGWIHIVKWLLDNIEHTSLDINTAMHTVLHRDFVGPDNTLVRLLLQYPINDTVDVDEIIQECCWWGLVDLVQLICDKNDPNQLDMKEAMNTACSRNHFDLVEWMLANIENNLFDLPTAFDKAIHADCDDLNASLITILINRIDNELINMASLLKIKDKDCLYDIVECVLGSVDHNKFDFQEAFNTVYDTIYGDDDSDINSKKEKYLPLIKLILEKVNPESLELTDALNQACRDCSSDVVTYY
ncbi:unnamed protein product [Mytilus edulis]|uniref:Ankyrin repeat protein n=1 Tax=Mytilus edulis TaxID=6550 RepID=A0A8S3UV62_MYTED|nr:unnamed protein product [Mytilus edulis]